MIVGIRDRPYINALERDTLWHPGTVHHAAGAMLLSAYNLFTKLAIKFIARRRGTIVKTFEDHDLTDYPALEMFIDRFGDALEGGPGSIRLCGTTTGPVSVRGVAGAPP